MADISKKKLLVIVGQTPPPWHGQAVATQMLFDAPWERYDVRKIRMAFSSEMEEVGRANLSKAIHILDLWKSIQEATSGCDKGILIYPPASPNWVPMLRDLILLPWVRSRFRTIVYLYHAGGFGEWCSQSRFHRWIAKCAYGVADLSLEVAKEEPSPHQVLSARSWAWTPYGVQVPPLAPQRKTANERAVVLFVGSLQEGKGVLEVIKTASILKGMGKEEDFFFRIVGRWFSSKFEAEAREMRSELNLEGMVEFPGQLTGIDKWKAYSNADIFFFPTHYSSEAFPLVLIEALGSGLPVVTTRWRGIPDLLDGCAVARLCAIKAPEEYVDALLTFKSMAKEGVDVINDARAFYEEKYLPDHFLAQVESLVSEAALGIQAASTNANTRIVGNRSLSSIPCGPQHSHKLPPIQFSSDTESSSLAHSIIHVAIGYPKETSSGAVQFHNKTTNGTKVDPQVRDKIRVSTYLADQHPGHDRSLGISRMSKVILDEMAKREDIGLKVLCASSSQKGPEKGAQTTILPWSTRSRIMRLLTDHFHPVLDWFNKPTDVWYFPKGFLPRFNLLKAPTVVTVHDTIIQYYQDHHPGWRKPMEYAYWNHMLTHTLKNADAIFTVSEISKKNIRSFMQRQGLPEKDVLVTYEPCLYEFIPQPEDPQKKDYVVHLASREPHKHTHELIRWWTARSESGETPPMLTLVGQVPPESEELIEVHPCIRRHGFLGDDELQTVIREARALILASEIEGFGLPALEAYYLGTPVCFVKDTSVDEILGESTSAGAFRLTEPDSLWDALDQVLAMPAPEVRRIGLELRKRFAAAKVVDRMIEGFRSVVVSSGSNRSNRQPN